MITLSLLFYCSLFSVCENARVKSSYDRLILFDDLSCIALNKEMVKKMVSLINYSSKLVVLLS